jgi:hypothetical protein
MAGSGEDSSFEPIAGESLRELVYGVNVLMQQVCCPRAAAPPLTRIVQVRVMQQKIAQIEPTTGAHMDPKPQARILKHKPPVLQVQQLPVSAVHPACHQHPRAATADSAEQRPPQGTGASSAKQLKTEKRRPAVAFGSCLPPEPSVVKCTAVASKGCTSNTARALTTPSFAAAAQPHDLAQFAATIHRSKVSSERPVVAISAAAPSFLEESASGCDADVQLHTSPPAFADLSRPKARVQQAQQWPLLERALHKYRQRKSPLDSCRKENVLSNEGAGAAGESPASHAQLPSHDALPPRNTAEAGVDAATGKSHSLALLGFSDSRIR